MGDLRYALRILGKAPGFSFVAIVSLALGIGANTAIFSLLNAVALRQLATVAPDRLVGLSSIDDRGHRAGFSYSTFERIRSRQRALSGIFAWEDGTVRTLEVQGSLFPGTALLASEDFAGTMPISPVIGRGFAQGDGAVAVLGYACWRRYFHSSPAALGGIIRVQGKPFTVIGVAPENFTDMEDAGAVDAIVPLAAFTSLDGQRKSRAPVWEVTGRLRSGVTLERARAELEAIWSQVRPAATVRLVVESAATGTGFNFPRMRFAYPLKLLLAMVGVLLLLASVNLATLLLARAEAKQREIGIRLALGAGRGRILRQYLAESMMLAIAGALAGAIFARWACRFLAQFVWTGNIDRAHDLSADGRVLAFTAAVAALSGLVFGLIPGWRALRTDPSVALQLTGRGTSGGVGHAGKGLMVFQVALSLTLVMAAALFTQTQRNLRSVALGFNSTGLIEMPLMNRPGGYAGMDPISYYPELFQRLARLPGVVSVSSATAHPVMPPVFPDQRVSAGGETAETQLFYVAPGYFRTMEIPLAAGREFSVHDVAASPRVAVVSQSLARRLFPDTQAIGSRVTVDGTVAKELVIAGIVRDSQIGSLQKHNALQLFTSVFQEDAARQPTVLVRTKGTPSPALAGQLRREVEAMGREYPLRIETMDRVIDRALVQERMMALLAAGLGVTALLLAAIGLYGLMSYSVTRRSADIGIRMAIGATRGAILRMILRESLTLVATGFALGAPAIYGGSKLVSGMLFGLNPLDGAAMATAATLLTGVAMAAAYLPARRAARLDPIASLKRN